MEAILSLQVWSNPSADGLGTNTTAPLSPHAMESNHHCKFDAMIAQSLPCQIGRMFLLRTYHFQADKFYDTSRTCLPCHLANKSSARHCGAHAFFIFSINPFPHVTKRQNVNCSLVWITSETSFLTHLSPIRQS